MFQFQDRRCYLCKEHCPKPAGSGDAQVINWPLLPYPGKDPQCIGYCPQNCTWEEPESVEDCETLQEEYFADKEKRTELEHQYHCFNSQVVEQIVQSGVSPDVADNYIKNVNEMIEKSREQGIDAFPEIWKEVPSLKKYAGPADDGTPEDHLKRTLNSAWTLDRDMIIKFTKKTTRKMATIPNLDGTWGGEACLRNSDRKKLSIRQDDDEKFDKNTMTNGIPRDQKEFFGVGNLHISLTCVSYVFRHGEICPND